jgi:hypothetical protein
VELWDFAEVAEIAGEKGEVVDDCGGCDDVTSPKQSKRLRMENLAPEN